MYVVNVVDKKSYFSFLQSRTAMEAHAWCPHSNFYYVVVIVIIFDDYYYGIYIYIIWFLFFYFILKNKSLWLWWCVKIRKI